MTLDELKAMTLRKCHWFYHIDKDVNLNQDNYLQVLHYLQEDSMVASLLLEATMQNKFPPDRFFKRLFREIDAGISENKNELLLKAAITNALSTYYKTKYINPEDERYKQKDINFFENTQKIDYSAPYKFNPNHQISIWFSQSPDIALPKDIANALIKRRKILSADKTKISLIFARKLLNSDAYNDLQIFAEKYHIHLIELDRVAQLQPELKSLIELELSKGGSMAAASDLCRWDDNIFHDSIYLDADLALDSRRVQNGQLATFHRGMPIAFNMGSLISNPKPETGKKFETISLNNDIIAYCGSQSVKSKRDRKRIIQRILNIIFTAYQRPSVILKNEPIGKTNFFKALCKNMSKAKEEKPITYYRLAITTTFKSVKNASAIMTLSAMFHFLGRDLFKEWFELENEKFTLLSNFILLNEPDEKLATQYFMTLFSKNESHLLNNFVIKINLIAKILYKSTVVEFSGPGAIYRALNEQELFNQQYRDKANSTALAARSLQSFFSVSEGVTGFVSDNICPWQTPVDEQKHYNQDGGRWLPG